MFPSILNSGHDALGNCLFWLNERCLSLPTYYVISLTRKSTLLRKFFHLTFYVSAVGFRPVHSVVFDLVGQPTVSALLQY